MQLILVVEDEPNIRMLVKEFLSEEGYQVALAQHGQAGLDWLDSRQQRQESLPNLILCDVMMPVMDGIRLRQHLQANSHYQAIPFIFLTATDPATFHTRRQHDLCIVKPFDIYQLLDTIAHSIALNLSGNTARFSC